MGGWVGVGVGGINYFNNLAFHIHRNNGIRCSRSYISFLLFAKAYIFWAPFYALKEKRGKSRNYQL